MYEQETCEESGEEGSEEVCEKSAGEKNRQEKTHRKKKINKKAVVKKPVKKAGAKRQVLANELRKLISNIDEEGLGFLLKQAQTIIHNLNVDRINKALEHTGRSGKKKTGKGGGGTVTAPSIVRVEDSASGKHYVVVLGRERKMFSREELRKVVAISHSGKSDLISGEQLFSWLKRNRGDVLFDVGIGSKHHPLLKKFSEYLRTHYAVKK